jgi:transposase
MRTVCLMAAVLIGTGVVAARSARGEQQQLSPECAKVVVALEESGGGLSADEIATKTGTDVKTVRKCTDLWRSTMKDAPAPKGTAATLQPMPAGGGPIVAAMDESGGALSADEVAKKTGTDVQTVRKCIDQWRRTMKGSASP